MENQNPETPREGNSGETVKLSKEIKRKRKSAEDLDVSKDAAATKPKQKKQTGKNSNKIDKRNSYATRSKGIVDVSNEETFITPRRGVNNNAQMVTKNQTFEIPSDMNTEKRFLLVGENSDDDFYHEGDGVDVDVEDDLDYEDDVEYNERQTMQESEDEESEIELGATGSTVEEERILRETPGLRKLFNKYFDERLKETTKLTKGTQNEEKTKTKKVGGKSKIVVRQIVKSPSDTTIYTPALRKRHTGLNMNQAAPVNTNMKNPANYCGNNIVDRISNFVESIRMEETMVNPLDDVQPGTSGIQAEQNTELKTVDKERNEAMRRTEQAVVQAEKFKASVASPPGTNFNFVQNNIPEPIDPPVEQFVLPDQNRVMSPPNGHNNVGFQPGGSSGSGSGLSDDDFFHLTCHVDKALKSKIERGEFIDLDRLLPKGNGPLTEENRTAMQWVQSDQGMFLVPARKQNRINGFRRWEQAFRIYATIYCSENPQRSREVWQYISVINTAANAFVWDNVYSYDIVFRQLMEFNPARSWSVTYNQMWNLSMKEPLTKNNFRSPQINNLNQGFGTETPNNKSFRKFGGRKIKADYCWNFNRGVKCKYGNKCKYHERCSYCDSTAHGIYFCPKLDKKEGKTSSKTSD